MNETGNTGYISAETVPPEGGVIDRAARAILAKGGFVVSPESMVMASGYARAAIEAVQEPTHNMISGLPAEYALVGAAVWSAMIGAALKEPA